MKILLIDIRMATNLKTGYSKKYSWKILLVDFKTSSTKIIQKKKIIIIIIIIIKGSLPKNIEKLRFQYFLFIIIWKFIHTYIHTYRAIYITKGKKRNLVCRYSEFHETHTTKFSLLVITLYRNGAIQ